MLTLNDVYRLFNILYFLIVHKRFTKMAPFYDVYTGFMYYIFKQSILILRLTVGAVPKYWVACVRQKYFSCSEQQSKQRGNGFIRIYSVMNRVKIINENM